MRHNQPQLKLENYCKHDRYTKLNSKLNRPMTLTVVTNLNILDETDRTADQKFTIGNEEMYIMMNLRSVCTEREQEQIKICMTIIFFCQLQTPNQRNQRHCQTTRFTRIRKTKIMNCHTIQNSRAEDSSIMIQVLELQIHVLFCDEYRYSQILGSHGVLTTKSPAKP